MLSLLGLAVALGAAAPESANSPPSTLEFHVARATARERYPALLSARLQAQAAGKRADAAGWWDDPMVGVSLWQMPLSNVNGALMPGLTAQERAITFARGPDMIPLMVMAQQTFPWPGKRAADAREARAVSQQSQAQSEQLRADVDRALAYAFAESAAAARTLETLRETMTVLDAIVSISDARVTSNVGSPLDAVNARGARDALKRDIINAEQQLGIARSRLATLIGLADPALVPPIHQRIAVVDVPDRTELLAAALQQRPELRGARAAVAAALARAEGARLAAIPDVTANVAYMANVGGAGMLIDEGPYRALLGGPDMVTVGVSIPLPVFAPWKQRREAEAASLEHRRAAADVDALIAVIQADVDEAMAGLDHARKHLDLHGETLIPLAQRAVEMAQASYESGQGSLVTMLDAVRTLRLHHLDLFAAQVEYARHIADLERATGRPLVKFVPDEE